MIQKDNFYVITGGPGVGKTSLLEELKRRGYPYVPEVAREIIKNQMETNGDALPWKNRKTYSDLMLARSIETYKEALAVDTILFFDRGIPDTSAYERLIGLAYNEALETAVREYRYNKTVFILPPWKEIYQTDTERKQDFREAVDTYHIMRATYKEAGYSLITLPPASVEERAEFVLSKLS